MSEAPTVTVEILSPGDLAPVDIAAWERLQTETVEFSNPLLGRRFSQVVAAVRDDVRVAVYRRNGQAVGFLPFHKRPGGLARPVGAPFSDYQALVSNGHIGIPGREALALAGIRAFRANGLVDPFGQFDTRGFDEVEAFVLEPGASGEAYLEVLRVDSPKRFKNLRRLEHRLERDFGEIRFVANDRSQASFDLVLWWKSAQFRRTGLQDVLGPQWVTQLMRNLFALESGPMTGNLASLYAGQTLVAAHFGIRQGETFHPWLASANPALAEQSPGQIFLVNAIRAMPQDGIAIYDLASGHDHYKRPFGPRVKIVKSGLVTAGAGRSFLPAAPAPVRKVMRRLDHIATLNPTLAGRARGLAEAAVAISRRGLGNASSSEGVA